MELFEEIRRGQAVEETIKGLAKKPGVYRRSVRLAIANVIPPARKRFEKEWRRLGPVEEIISRWKPPQRAGEGSGIPHGRGGPWWW